VSPGIEFDAVVATPPPHRSCFGESPPCGSYACARRWFGLERERERLEKDLTRANERARPGPGPPSSERRSAGRRAIIRWYRRPRDVSVELYVAYALDCTINLSGVSRTCGY